MLAALAAETRRCYDCGLVKPIDEFAFADKAKGTRQGRCRKCHAAYRRAHYVRNRDTYIKQEVARIRRYREENRPLIREYLRAHPCVDCGETDIVVLDFDHRDPSEKKHVVTILASHKPWSRVLEEIARCDVRCSNCHRRRTAAQFGWRSRSLRGPAPVEGRRHKAPSIPASESIALPNLVYRRCTGCQQTKPITEFGFKDRARGKRRSRCLECTRAYARKHYQLNRPVYLKKAHQSRHELIQDANARILEYLLTHPCLDCGETDVRVLDFHHRDRSAKIGAVSQLIRRVPWIAVLTEILKCDVRCANCHRRKTAREFGWMKLHSLAS